MSMAHTASVVNASTSTVVPSLSLFQHDKIIPRVEKSIKTCQIAKILLAVSRGPKSKSSPSGSGKQRHRLRR